MSVSKAVRFSSYKIVVKCIANKGFALAHLCLFLHVIMQYSPFLGSALPQYEVLHAWQSVCLVQLAKKCSPNLISVTARLAWPQLPYSTYVQSLAPG